MRSPTKGNPRSSHVLPQVATPSSTGNDIQCRDHIVPRHPMLWEFCICPWMHGATATASPGIVTERLPREEWVARPLKLAWRHQLSLEKGAVTHQCTTEKGLSILISFGLRKIILKNNFILYLSGITQTSAKGRLDIVFKKETLRIICRLYLFHVTQRRANNFTFLCRLPCINHVFYFLCPIALTSGALLALEGWPLLGLANS